MRVAETLLHVPLVAGLADQHGHGWLLRIGRGNDCHGLRLDCRILVVVATDHVEIHRRRVVFRAAPAMTRVAGKRSVKGIETPHMIRQLSPGTFVPFGFLGNFAGKDPEDRIRSIAAHEVTPVALQALKPNRLHAIAIPTPPGADDHRRETALDEVLDAAVGVVKILGIHLFKLHRLVGQAALIRHACLKETLVGIRPANDLDGIESLLLAIGGEFLKSLPCHPLAEVLPPGISQPKKRRAVRVREGVLVLRYSHRPMFVERVITRARNHLDLAVDAVKSGVRRIFAFGLPRMDAG